MFAKLLFLYCSLVILASGLAAIRMRNPVHSVLMVLLLFFHMAGLYLLLGAEFLAAVQVIVYAGAILVLYLFVLFLVSLKEELRLGRFVDSAWLGMVLAGGIGAGLLYILPLFVPGRRGQWPPELVRQVTHTKALGQEMYSTFILPFEIAGLILLIAVIGGLVLARKDKEAEQ